MAISPLRSRSPHPGSACAPQPNTRAALIRRTRRALLTAIALAAVGNAHADAQATRQPLRVQLHVAAEATLKPSALGYLTAALRPAIDVVITDRDADYVLSAVILPTTEGGYAVSTVVMNVYSERRLADFSARWELT